LLAAFGPGTIINGGTESVRSDQIFGRPHPFAARQGIDLELDLLKTFSRRLLVLILLAVVQSACTVAQACVQCQRFGTTAFHDLAIGGDEHDDTTTPNVSSEEGLASGQFVLQGGKFFQPGGLGSPVTITYSYKNLLDGGLKDINNVSLPVALIRGSIEEALGVWASHVPLHFVEVPDQGGPADLVDYPNGQFGQIRFSHLPINGADIPGQPPIAKAMARFPNSGGNYASDVYFDNGDPWQEAGTLSQPDILGAAIHEIGHAIGLGHTDVSTANMYWIFRRFSALGTGQLFPDDIAGIQLVYGAGVGSVTPLAVPEPSAAVMTIAAVVGLLALSSRKSGRPAK